MKRIFFILIAVTACYMNTFAYEYLPIVKEGCEWEEVIEFNLDGTPWMSDKLWFEGDTVIYGEKYKKLHIRYNILSGTDHGIVTCMREEDKRVYLYDDRDKRTYLLYDFNYHKGDTIPSDNKDVVPTIVIDEDTIVVKGISRRRLTLKYASTIANGPRYLVEGIGYYGGLLCTINGYSFGGHSFYQYYENGVPVFGRSDFDLPHNGVSWIEPVKATRPRNSVTDSYDLTGRRIVGAPSRGIYVKGGRKIMVR